MTKAKKETVKAVAAKNNLSEAVKKPMNRFGKQEKHTVDGIEYTFQFPGVKRAQEIVDLSKMANGLHSDLLYNESLMKDVIVAPKTDWDYWDENEGYMEVLGKADRFLAEMLR